MQPLISIIIVNWNGQDLLHRCLESLRHQKYSPIEIIVVDNASEDGSVQLIEENFPEVILIKNSSNVGFAAGNNIGAALAKGEFLFLLNSDAWVKEDTIDKLVSTALANPDVGIVGAKLLNSDGTFQEAGLKIDLFGFPVGNSLEYALGNTKNSLLEKFFFISGAAMLVQSGLYSNLSGFEESYFMFCEDLDLCWRARLLGKKIVICMQAEVFHQGGASIVGGIYHQNQEYRTSLKRIYLRERNTLTLLVSNYSFLWLFLILPFYLLSNISEIIILTVLGRSSIARCYIDAYFWNAKRLSKTIQKRKNNQAKRLISDKSLWPLFYHGLGKLHSMRMIDGLPKV